MRTAAMAMAVALACAATLLLWPSSVTAEFTPENVSGSERRGSSGVGVNPEALQMLWGEVGSPDAEAAFRLFDSGSNTNFSPQLTQRQALLGAASTSSSASKRRLLGRRGAIAASSYPFSFSASSNRAGNDELE